MASIKTSNKARQVDLAKLAPFLKKHSKNSQIHQATVLSVSITNNQRLPMKLKYCILFLLLAGCASNSGVVPMGNDTYMISRQAASGFSGMGTLKADAMREAYSQCQKTGKRVEVLETIDAKPPYIFGNFPKTEIRFQCVQ